MGFFIAGALFGAFAVWWLYVAARRDCVRLDEEKQHLQQEKQIVVEFMHNLVEAIGEGVGRQQLFQRIVHAGILSTGALSACVFERDENNKLRGVAVEGLFPPQRPIPKSTLTKLATRAKFIEQILQSEIYEMGEGLIGSVAKSGQAVLINDALKDPRVVKHQDPSLIMRSLIVAPILFRKKVLGVLAVVNPADGLSFNQTDFSLVRSLAEQAGMAIHNSDYMTLQIEKNKLDFDLSLASSVQGLLLPTVFPAIAHLSIDAAYRPAQKVGGDLYDVFALDDHRIGVAIADVSGKGVSASLLMAICQTNLRHYARQYDSPREVLVAVNQAMSGEIRSDMFITTIYAVVDGRDNSITLARAGHELPLIVRHARNGEPTHVESVGSEGMAVGMVPPEIFDAVITEKTVPFESGDILVLYTDGVTEPVNRHGEEYGSDRLSDSLLSLADKSVQEISQGILARMERFIGNAKPHDDVTLICVKHS